MAKIGVYICHCGTNIASSVDVGEVVNFVATLPNVAVAREYKFICSDPGQTLIKEDIKKGLVDRVVVASCSPLMHEITFRKACEDAGLNQYLFQMANIREHVSWVTVDPKKATSKAKALISAAVRKVSLLEPLETKMVPINPDALVIGGGIAGIQVALDIANSGKIVHLVEKEPSIGGHMSKFDKTFPTLDCAACILTPKMVNVTRQKNIKLYSYSEVEKVEGYVGNFTITIKKKPRYVEIEKCNSCGECLKVCPVEVPNNFDEGMGLRKAIYRPFPQAVPGTFLIDRSAIAPCKAACPAGTNVQGYIALIRAGKYEEAYQLNRLVNPFPSVCGRVCVHPCEAKCGRKDIDEALAIKSLKRFVADWHKSNYSGKPEKPKIIYKEKVAVIGAGPAGLAVAYQLIKKGYPVTVFEAMPVGGGMMQTGIPDFRLPKDILAEEIKYIQEMGVEIKYNTKIGKDISFDEIASKYNAVFIAVGCQSGTKLKIPGERFEGVVGAVDFLRQVNLNAPAKNLEGKRVAVIGGGNAAFDAARTAIRLKAKEVTIFYRRRRAEMPANDWDIEEGIEERVKIKFLVAPVEILGKDGKVSGIKCIKMQLGDADASGRRKPIPISDSEFNVDCEIVIPAISQETEFDFLPSDIERSKWGTIIINDATGQTTRQNVFAGGDCTRGPDTIIGAIAEGNKASVAISRLLRGEDISKMAKADLPIADVDKTNVPKFQRSKVPTISINDRVKTFKEVELGFTEEDAKVEALRCLNCGICSECYECAKVCEPKAIDYNMSEERVEVKVGAVIVATGFKQFDYRRMPQYGYGRLDNVVAALEFERMCSATGPTGGEVRLKDGRKPSSIAIIHCVGSRDKNYNAYCSRVCCMYALKFSHLAKEKTNAEVYDFYIDMRTPGKGYEEFYSRLLEEEVRFIRGKVAQVTDYAIYPEEEGKLIVRCEDTLLGRVRRIPVDMVILCGALEAADDAIKLGRTLTINCGKEGWFKEAHPKLAPVSTPTDGVFIAGACQGPKDIPDTVSQGHAAAAETMALIDAKEREVEAVSAKVDDNICTGCKICNDLCPYHAIEYKIDNKVSEINEALCKGCGTCAAACPSAAVIAKHFTDRQIMAEIEGVLI